MPASAARRTAATKSTATSPPSAKRRASTPAPSSRAAASNGAKGTSPAEGSTGSKSAKSAKATTPAKRTKPGEADPRGSSRRAAAQANGQKRTARSTSRATSKEASGKLTRRSGVRGAANAQALVAAAHRLVAEKGENFTTQDLVKEADVALQTLYRHFGGKDQLLLRVLSDHVNTHCNLLASRVADIDDPVERLRFYVEETVSRMVDRRDVTNARFMTAQHWRLHQEHPDELAEANKPFADLVQTELEAGQRAGALHPRDPARDAWLITRLVMAVYQYYAFADQDSSTSAAADDVWDFCLAAVGGAPPD